MVTALLHGKDWCAMSFLYLRAPLCFLFACDTSFSLRRFVSFPSWMIRGWTRQQA